jgi:hypothetical protein
MQTKTFNIDELTLEEIVPRQATENDASNIGRKCLKCSHSRLASENHVPAYECPKCGAVYDKVEQFANTFNQSLR